MSDARTTADAQPRTAPHPAVPPAGVGAQTGAPIAGGPQGGGTGPRVGAKLSIATRVFVGFMLLLAVFVAFGLLLLVRVNAVGEGPRVVQTTLLPVNVLVLRAESNIDTRRREFRRLADNPDFAFRVRLLDSVRPLIVSDDSVVKELSEATERLERAIEPRAQTGASGYARIYKGVANDLHRMIERENDIRNVGLEVLDRVAAQAEAGDPEAEAMEQQGIAERIAEFDRLNVGQLSDLARVKARLRPVTNAELNRASLASDRLVFVIALFTAIGSVLAVIAMIVVQRSLTPLNQLGAIARRVASGDYSQRVAQQVTGATREIATLALDFDRMVASLRARDNDLRREEQRVAEALIEVQRSNLALTALKTYNENIVRSVRVGIIAVDANLSVTSANPAAQTLWGERGASLVGRPATELIPGHALLASRASLMAVLDGDRLVHAENVSPAAQPSTTAEEAGEEFATGPRLDVTVVPLRSNEGVVEGLLFIAEDVTERLAMRRKLLRSERLAAIGSISTQVAHEVRNPLNSISLNVELLEDEIAELAATQSADASEPRAILASIQREIQRLVSVTEQYLGYARLPPPRMEREQVTAMLSSLLAFQQGEFNRRRIRLETDLDRALPAITGDPDQLRQAFMNIIRNACDAMPEGGTLNVSARVSGEGQGIAVAIRDTGHGMPPEIVARIFDPFYSTKRDGTGLGLALTRQIISLHGGEIACESAPGAGTTFIITLPVDGSHAA
jgi:PAS domain S-box-containing protein